MRAKKNDHSNSGLGPTAWKCCLIIIWFGIQTDYKRWHKNADNNQVSVKVGP